MKDINNKELITGQIVEIKGAYFKNDNGLYFIEHSPEDVSWSGNEYCLKKICKSGKLSTASKNCTFYPIIAFTNNKAKNLECKKWNEKHVTIEIINTIDNSNVVEYFKKEKESFMAQHKRNLMLYGKDTTDLNKCIDFCNDIINRLEKNSCKDTKKEIKNTEESAQTKENNTEEVQENNLQCEVKLNTEKNGIELYFNDKPSEEIRNQLKANKFRWSKYNKCWYCKDSEEQRQFLKDIGLLNTDNKNIDTEKIVNRDYPEINIDDIDTYTIDKSLSDAENNVSMFRSKDIDHQQEIQNRLQNANNIVIELLQHNNDKYIEYKVKSFLQWYKKKSYELYIKILRHKANNPSWAVTGRGNLNVSRYNKKLEQYNNLLNSYCQLDEKFNNYIDKIKRKIND